MLGLPALSVRPRRQHGSERRVGGTGELEGTMGGRPWAFTGYGSHCRHDARVGRRVAAARGDHAGVCCTTGCAHRGGSVFSRPLFSFLGPPR